MPPTLLVVLLATAAHLGQEPAPAGSPPAAVEPAPDGAEPLPAPPPAPPVAPEGVAKAASPPKPDDGPRTEGLIPGVLVGPKVAAALLFPPNVMVGVELKVLGWVGVSFDYGVFPHDDAYGGYKVTANTWNVGLKAYPFRGAFFVGLVYGSYDLTGTQDAGVPVLATSLNLKSSYLGPQIGWKWAFDFGLFLGLNMGYGFSLDYTSTLVGPPGSSAGDLRTIQENADKYLKPGAPIFTLLEIGWFI